MKVLEQIRGLKTNFRQSSQAFRGQAIVRKQVEQCWIGSQSIPEQSLHNIRQDNLFPKSKGPHM